MNNFNFCKNMYKNTLPSKFVVVIEKITHKTIYYIRSDNEVFTWKWKSEWKFKEKKIYIEKKKKTQVYPFESNNEKNSAKLDFQSKILTISIRKNKHREDVISLRMKNSLKCQLSYYAK